MKITARADYAVLALFDLALHSGSGWAQAREIAKNQQVPLRFLEQILIQLRRAGLVKSLRGASGGYQLAKTPSQITLKDAIEAVEGELTIVDARDGEPSTVQKVWAEVENAFLETLESVTIEDLVRRKMREEKVIVYHI